MYGSLTYSSLVLLTSFPWSFTVCIHTYFLIPFCSPVTLSTTQKLNTSALATLYRLFFVRSIAQFFYTNLPELFCQFISWTNWVNSGKFMDNCWISYQGLADTKNVYDDLIIINLYLLLISVFRGYWFEFWTSQPALFYILALVPLILGNVCLSG